MAARGTWSRRTWGKVTRRHTAGHRHIVRTAHYVYDARAKLFGPETNGIRVQATLQPFRI